MRWLSPKVLFELIRQRLGFLGQRLGFLRQRLGFVGALLGRVGGVLDTLRIWRRPKVLLATVGGIVLLGVLAVAVLPSPEKGPTAGAKVKQVKKVKTAAQLKAEADKKKAEAEAERLLRAQLLADTRRVLATVARKLAEEREQKRLAELNRKLKWISHGNGRFWKVTRLGYEGLPSEKKDQEQKEKGPEENLFSSNAFPRGAEEGDGTYTIGDDPNAPKSSSDDDKKTLPGKDWREHIWKTDDKGKKKPKKEAMRRPQIIPASYIYATLDSSEKDVLALPDVVDRVFRYSSRLLVDADYGAEAIEAWGKALPVDEFVSLTAIVRGNMFGTVERIGYRYGMSSGHLDRLNPWAVWGVFSIEPAEYLRRRSGQHALPEALLRRAMGRGMPVTALETVKQTVKIHSDFTDAEQIDLLAKSVRLNREVEKYRADLTKAYLAGETAKMTETYRRRLTEFGLILAQKIGPRFVEQRSRRMVDNMIPHLNQGRAFIVVPAINMAGSNGVLRMLSRRGYRVRYVETDPSKPILVASYVNSPYFGDTLDPTPPKKPTAKIAEKKDEKMAPKETDKAMIKRDPNPKKTQEATRNPE